MLLFLFIFVFYIVCLPCMFRVTKYETYMVTTGIAVSFQVLSLIAITMANDTVEMTMIIQKKSKLDILN